MSLARRAAAPVLLAALVLAGCGQVDDEAGSGPAATTGAAPTPSQSPATPGSASPEPSTAVVPTTPVPTTPGGGMPTTTTGPPSRPGDRPTGGTVPLMPRPTAPPTAPTDVPSPVVLVGEVVEPSSPGCVEMTSGGQVWTLLLPAGASVAVGDRVRVSGTPRPVGRGSSCAGTPVVVGDVAPAG